MFKYKHKGGIFFVQLEQLVKEYLLELKLENYSKRTIETYKQHINKFLSFYKEKIDTDLDIDNISKIHYKLFISQLLGTFRHYYTVKNVQLGQDVFTISKLLGTVIYQLLKHTYSP